MPSDVPVVLLIVPRMYSMHVHTIKALSKKFLRIALFLGD